MSHLAVEMEYLFQDSKTPQFLSRETRLLIETIGETKNRSTEEEIIGREIQSVKRQLSQPCDP